MLAAAKSSNPDPLGPLLHGLGLLWPLWLLVALVGVGKLAWRLYELRRLSRSGIADVDRMDGTTFEVFLTTLSVVSATASSTPAGAETTARIWS